MRKRRRHLKARFWVLLACLVMVGTSIWVSGQNSDVVTESGECVGCMSELPEEKDYILGIPLMSEHQEELYQASEEFGVDYYVMVALVDRESDFENVIGDGGDSYGYCQIQPKWWYGVMVEIGATDLTIPRDNFRTACAIMAKLIEKNGSVEGALVEYNQGYYNGEGTEYSRDILDNADRYRA